jgi:tetrapyrrole methylase family protein/MazG family protein/ATP diphosphatase
MSRPSLSSQDGRTLPRLVEIMQRLLGPGGCPWDREQTFESLRPYVVEEAHEVVDAIDRGSAEQLREELGDLLLQIVFLAELARARGWFGPDDVIEVICDKMVRRHPHVFGDARAESAEEVLRRWEQGKAAERAAKGDAKGALDGVPVAMPALLRAVRIGEKASRVGYDWPEASGARDKIDEELRELDEAVASGDRARMEHELGDLIFAVASWARKSGLDPEAALRGALDRFTRRFAVAEARARAAGVELADLDPAALDRLWREAKGAVG